MGLRLPGEPQALAARVLATSGLDRVVDALVARFDDDAGGAGGVTADPAALAADAGARLWRAALERARRPRPSGPAASGTGLTGDPVDDPTDDRPLYWARLTVRVRLQQWAARTGQDAGPALAALERSSRGLDDVAFPPGEQTTRVLVTGFDPFRLDDDLSRSNPSGAAVLALHGRQVSTATGSALVQAVVLPVRWQAFDDGVVEDAVGPHLLGGEGDADVVMTVSQGSPGLFSVEGWAGAWRGGGPDNEREVRREEVPPARGWPQPGPDHVEQLLRTTLPAAQMLAAGTGPFPVELRERIRVWTGGTRDGEPVTTSEPPQPGWLAAAGGGGDYLSNEAMYRANRLRRSAGRHDVLGGHLHVPAFTGEHAGRCGEVAVAEHRRAVVDQTVALVVAAARAAARAEPGAGSGAAPGDGPDRSALASAVGPA
ncbi:hypothetical protein [Pseudokineococcus sp. 1T1Z-3]|uniref:hypothetical protein n=1 Tax=Pseudokineococcus sp. 1T1Z-3 TaxID=3132745 RepID=UPI0030AFE83E